MDHDLDREMPMPVADGMTTVSKTIPLEAKSNANVAFADIE
jgi:hypothetical protein